MASRTPYRFRQIPDEHVRTGGAHSQQAGTYAVAYQGAAMRRRELEIRMAVGASPAMLVSECSHWKAFACGLLGSVGLTLAFVVRSAWSRLLFGLGTTDVDTYAWPESCGARLSWVPV